MIQIYSSYLSVSIAQVPFCIPQKRQNKSYLFSFFAPLSPAAASPPCSPPPPAPPPARQFLMNLCMVAHPSRQTSNAAPETSGGRRPVCSHAVTSRNPGSIATVTVPAASRSSDSVGSARRTSGRFCRPPPSPFFFFSSSESPPPPPLLAGITAATAQHPTRSFIPTPASASATEAAAAHAGKIPPSDCNTTHNTSTADLGRSSSRTAGVRASERREDNSASSVIWEE
mmetsp:Transcript_5108/g.14702  ORF Transcript_5108/g.14702 Transcript_5108/m.14702 type:complete len:228 (+) Transcript_5108:128-811(+)